MRVTKLQLTNLLKNYMECVKILIYSNGKYAYDQFVNAKISDYQVWNNCANACCRYQQEYDQIKTIVDYILIDYDDNYVWIFENNNIYCIIRDLIAYYEVKCEADYLCYVDWDEAIKEF